MTRSRCSRCGVLSVSPPGSVCGPCERLDKAAEDKLRRDLDMNRPRGGKGS